MVGWPHRGLSRGDRHKERTEDEEIADDTGERTRCERISLGPFGADGVMSAVAASPRISIQRAGTRDGLLSSHISAYPITRLLGTRLLAVSFSGRLSCYLTSSSYLPSLSDLRERQLPPYRPATLHDFTRAILSAVRGRSRLKTRRLEHHKLHSPSRAPRLGLFPTFARHAPCPRGLHLAGHWGQHSEVELPDRPWHGVEFWGAQPPSARRDGSSFGRDIIAVFRAPACHL